MRVKVLDKGFVRLVDHMGDDAAIVQAARVSYGAGTKSVREDRGLIRHLMRHGHTSPFEQVEFKFHVKVPMDCWRQWIRHRTASVNEYSTRYSEAMDEKQCTAPNEWRLQNPINKQGSAGVVTAWPENYDTGDIYVERISPGVYLSEMEAECHENMRITYQERLRLGVAREQARKDLPLSNYTQAYWKMDLHNLFHFLKLRMDSHAQHEIRAYANAIFELIKPIVPLACEAFEDYRLRAITLSAQEIEGIKARHHNEPGPSFTKREQQEFDAKLARLGLLP